MLGKLSVPGRPDDLNNGRARAYCACSRCGWGEGVFVHFYSHLSFLSSFSGGTMVLGKLPVPGRPTILITVGQGPIALAVGAGGDGLDIFTLIYLFFYFSLFILSQGPLNPKQPTNHL